MTFERARTEASLAFTYIKTLLFSFGILDCLVGNSGQQPAALINGDAGKVIRFSDDGLTPFPYGQRFARVDVLEGKPVFKVTTGDKTNGINAGFWESSQGK